MSEASSFNQPFNLSDTSAVTDMAYIFLGATAFNQPLSLDARSVVTMEYSFSGAAAFNQPLTLITTSALANARGGK